MKTVEYMGLGVARVLLACTGVASRDGCRHRGVHGRAIAADTAVNSVATSSDKKNTSVGTINVAAATWSPSGSGQCALAPQRTGGTTYLQRFYID